MKLDELAAQPSSWLRAGGALNDVVVFYSARLSRNVDGYGFVNRAAKFDLGKLLRETRAATADALADYDATFFDYSSVAPTHAEISFMHERRLIDSDFTSASAPSALLVEDSEAFSLMFNGQDHLRFLVNAPGLAAKELWARLDALDNLVESRLRYAFDDNYGYLAANPLNAGTGLNISVKLHLPGLLETGEMTRALRSFKKVGLEYDLWEGEEMPYVLTTGSLGSSEEEVASLVDEVVQSAATYERKARQALLEEGRQELLDRCYRALGILQTSRIMSLKEARGLLSSLRLGVALKVLEGPSLLDIDQMLLEIYPGHLRMLSTEEGATPKDASEDELRARRLRSRLASLT